MSNTIYHTPYTYLIRFKPTGQVYYGVRYAKNCHPNDLWTSYFTSSKTVKTLIEKHGKEAFDYEVRKTFTTMSEAIQWESKVLQRMNVIDNDKWLNHHNSKSIDTKCVLESIKQRLVDGTHPFLSHPNCVNSNKIRLKNGTHNFITNHPNIKSIRDGKHPWQSKEHKEKCSELAKLRVTNGSHNLLDNPNHPSKEKWICEECNVVSNAAGIARHQKKTKHSGRRRRN